MDRKRKWTEEQLIEAVATSCSVSQVLSKLGLVAAGGNFASINKHIERLNLDRSHFTGQGHLRGKTHNWSKKIPTEDILTKKSEYNRGHLKNRLIKEGLLENTCSLCGIDTWLEKPLSLHLDHINGVRNDNRLENLRLLCPNCHSQTDTYCGKNIGKLG